MESRKLVGVKFTIASEVTLTIGYRNDITGKDLPGPAFAELVIAHAEGSCPGRSVGLPGMPMHRDSALLASLARLVRKDCLTEESITQQLLA